MKSISFTMGRLLATSTTQLGLSTGTPPWVWSGKPAAQWGTEHTALEQLRIDEINKRAEWRATAATWDLALGSIQRGTRDVKREGIYHFRAQPAVVPRFRALRTDAESRERIYNQGEAARALWAKADGAWVFDPDLELSAFGSLLAKARALDRDCMNWYKVATVRFPAGTVDGDLILARVPTTTRPRRSRAKRPATAIRMVGRGADKVLPFPEAPEQTAA